MVRHKDLCSVAYQKFWIKTCFFNILKFVDEFIDVECYAVADNTGCVVVANTRRHKMQSKSAVFVNDSVSCIGTALKANNNVALFGKHIGDFTLAFVAPVSTYYCSYHFYISLKIMCCVVVPC